jgi:hypothetical protein
MAHGNGQFSTSFHDVPNEPKLHGFEASTIFPRKSPSLMAPFLRLFALLFRGTFTPGSVKHIAGVDVPILWIKREAIISTSMF